MGNCRSAVPAPAPPREIAQAPPAAAATPPKPAPAPPALVAPGARDAPDPTVGRPRQDRACDEPGDTHSPTLPPNNHLPTTPTYSPAHPQENVPASPDLVERRRALFRQLVELTQEGNAALRKVRFFRSLSGSGLLEAAKALKLLTFDRDEYVLRQGGEEGSFYMIYRGDCVAEVDGVPVSHYCGEGHFGEPAVLSGERQAASIRVTSAVLWCFRMPRSLFQNCMNGRMSLCKTGSLFELVAIRTLERIQALREVKLFQSLTPRELQLAAKAIVTVSFGRGNYVVRQGERGCDFFMVDHGKCVVEVEARAVRTYTKGDYFGERALLRDEPRAASVRAMSETLTCFRISRSVFKSLLKERIAALREVKLFKSLNGREIEEAAGALELVSYEEGDHVIRQHEQGSDFFMVHSGECEVEVDGAVVCRYSDVGSFGERALIDNEPRAASVKVTSKKLVCFRMSQKVYKKIMTDRIKMLRKVKLMQSFGYRELAEVAEALNLVSFKEGDYVMRQGEEGNEFFIVDSGQCVVEVDGVVVFEYNNEGSFGEKALLRDEPRAASVRAVSDTLSCFRISQRDFELIISDRNRKERLVKRCPMFETMSDEQVAVLVGAFRRVRYSVHPYAPPIIQQGAPTDERSCFYLLEKGECTATILQPDGSQQEVKSYRTGDIFGEKALIESQPRAASIVPRLMTDALSNQALPGNAILDGDLIADRTLSTSLLHKKIEIVVLELSRAEFEKRLGLPMSQLQAQLYNSDPRKLLADFYRRGDLNGPMGSLPSKEARTSETQETRAVPVAEDMGDAEMLECDRKGDLHDPLGTPSSEGAHTFGNRDVPAVPGADAVDAEVPAAGSSRWFAVYRPCSRESIAKMIGKVGVGKGLNVKGKSAKVNRLSGFVPFVQISDNAHKEKVEKPSTSPAYDIHVYFRSAANRDEVKVALERCLDQMVLPVEEAAPPSPVGLLTGYAKTALEGCLDSVVLPEVEVAAPSPIRFLTGYEESSSEPSFGLSVPEFLLMKFYVLKPDLSPMLGWETGRPSRPAFLNMNLHSVRMQKDGTPSSTPPTCLYQFDKGDPLNPAGLLVAYAEERHVKPVVSDFDTFLVGSQGAKPFDDLLDDQRALIMWLLSKTERVLLDKEVGIRDEEFDWTSSWLEKVLSEEAKKKDTFKLPRMPEFGFGDPTSYRLIGDVVDQLAECGAVRHGAECFNYAFPQELDEEFLVVWDGFECLTGKPWETLSEEELVDFLSDRARENFVFPLNPVWMVRDGSNGWSKLFELMLSNDHIKERIKCWYTEESIAKIRDLSRKVSDCLEELHPLPLIPLPKRSTGRTRRRTSALELSKHIQHNGSFRSRVVADESC